MMWAQTSGKRVNRQRSGGRDTAEVSRLKPFNWGGECVRWKPSLGRHIETRTMLIWSGSVSYLTFYVGSGLNEYLLRELTTSTRLHVVMYRSECTENPKLCWCCTIDPVSHSQLSADSAHNKNLDLLPCNVLGSHPWKKLQTA